MNNVYEICFIGGLILAIIFLTITVILFIVLGIPKVISDLSGRSAKKAIKDRKQGKTPDNSVAKKEQAKYYNQSSGKITARDTVSTETRAKNQDNTTDNLGKNKKQEKKPVFTPQFDPEETAVLGATPEMDSQIAKSVEDKSELPTDVLRDEVADEEATDVLKTDEKAEVDELDEEATDVLKSDEANELDEEATDVLKSDEAKEKDKKAAKAVVGDDAPTDVLKADDVESDNTDEAEDAPTDVLKSEDADEDSEAATDVLRAEDDDEPATDVLRGDQIDDEDSTTVLASKKTRQLAHKAKVIYNIVVVNTDEKI